MTRWRTPDMSMPMPSFRTPSTLIAALTTALFLAPGARAQVEVTPHLGMYIPVTELVREDLGPEVGEYQRRQIAMASLGARLSFWLSPRFGIESSLKYSPSLVAVRNPNTPVLGSPETTVSVKDISAGLFMGNLRALVALNPDSRGWVFHFGGGVGVITRFGTAWDDHRGTTDLAGVVGFGARTRPLGDVAFRFDLEGFISEAQFQSDQFNPTSAKISHDVVFSFGFAIPVSKP